MPQPYRSAIPPIDTMSEVVRLLDGLPTWHPNMASGSLDSGEEGAVDPVRRLITTDGGVVTERLLALDAEAHRLTYAIIDSPFAVRRYASTMHLSPVTSTGETFAEWFAEFDSEGADEDLLMALFGDGVFGAGLAAIADHLAR
ncbi:SRPBCC family protein [Dermatophilaceae bacterium Soc4.6]